MPCNVVAPAPALYSYTWLAPCHHATGFYMILLGHLAACGWYYIAEIDNHGDDSWTTLYGVGDQSEWMQYQSAM